MRDAVDSFCKRRGLVAGNKYRQYNIPETRVEPVTEKMALLVCGLLQAPWLHHLACVGSADAIRYALLLGEEVDCRCDASQYEKLVYKQDWAGMTPLMWASALGRADVVRALLEVSRYPVKVHPGHAVEGIQGEGIEPLRFYQLCHTLTGRVSPFLEWGCSGTRCLTETSPRPGDITLICLELPFSPPGHGWRQSTAPFDRMKIGIPRCDMWRCVVERDTQSSREHVIQSVVHLAMARVVKAGTSPVLRSAIHGATIFRFSGGLQK